MALEVTLATQQKQKVPHLCGILMGDETNEYISSYGHAELELFGKGKDKDLDFWKSVFRQANLYGYLEKDIAHMGVLCVSKKGMDFLEKPTSVKIWQRHDYEHEAEEEMDDSPRRTAGHDEALYGILKKLRKKIASQKNLPPYVIFQDPSMEEMATLYPTSKEELASINGVGQGKVRKFGKPFLEAISRYVEENDITTAADVQVKSTANKSKVKIFIIQQIDRKMDLEEIARAKGMDFHELLEEIEHICFSGTKLNLDYYIDQVLDEGKQDDLYDYFMEAETDSLEAALEEFEDEEISEEDIRLMRVKFMSEHAM
jgi:ATP-dependent DNA helicase RecQ